MTAPELNLSVVIPVFNMAGFLPELINSLNDSGVLDLATEVVLVNDGSTDNTEDTAKALIELNPKIRLHSLPQNLGRYLCRLEGAKIATTNHILFLDARLVLPSDFAEKIREHWTHSDFLQPQARIDTNRNLFCLYWDRSHRAIFRHHFESLERGPVDLTKDNYEQFLKGTTAILVPRGLFLECCEKIGPSLLSDDTALIRMMVETKPLRLAPDLWFWWVPREDWRSFLWRLYDRGPGLVEYHVFTKRGWIFQAILLGLILLAASLLALVVDDDVFEQMLVVGLITAALSTRLIAQSWSETLRLAPLHMAVLLAVGLGILKGLLVNSRRWMKGELKWATE